MTAKPYPHAVQKAARRGVLSAAGSKRVEVVLDAETKADLQAIMARLKLKQSAAVAHAVKYMADIVTARTPPKRVNGL